MAATLLDVCLLLLILIYTNALECDEEVVCLGLRPRGENGCCPLLKWEGCGNSRLRQCDEILGYSCINGICLGKYDNLFIYLSIYLSIYLLIYLFIYLFIHFY